jgi:cysteine sulfinate desulfinase/cysteine desulfurase-like protein
MPKTNPRKQEQFVTKEALGQLFTDQTSVILKAVEEGFESQDKRIEERFTAQNIALAAAMDKRLEAMEKRFNEKLDRLTTTLDRFLKRMTDVEEEFTFMKNDVNRIKAVLREKLGVSID